MIRIILCEDDRQMLEDTAKRIREILTEQKLSRVKVESFSNSALLLEKIRRGERASVYVLDVEMPRADGFEIARALTEEAVPAQKDSPVVIFLTSHEERSTEGYYVRAHRFVIKSRMEQELPEAQPEHRVLLAPA